MYIYNLYNRTFDCLFCDVIKPRNRHYKVYIYDQHTGFSTLLKNGISVAEVINVNETQVNNIHKAKELVAVLSYIRLSHDTFFPERIQVLYIREYCCYKAL